MEQKISAAEVADFFLYNQDEEDSLTHLKLQKLCYYAQGHYLAVFGESLFDDALLAWKHGPVVKSLWMKYRYTDSQPIERPEEFSGDRLGTDRAAFLQRVYEEYGQYSGWKLRDMSHSESPWREAEDNGKTSLSIDTMRDFFTGELRMRLTEQPKLTSEQVRDLVFTDPKIKQGLAQGRADFSTGRYRAL